jgi:hypothetical protein
MSSRNTWRILPAAWLTACAPVIVPAAMAETVCSAEVQSKCSLPPDSQGGFSPAPDPYG